ncbi:hypothetical protein [Actinoplanes sp. URMC 104]|uniref:hypothetical protein n=1 Tax=Actinoplanes sp. URMC 104 TaxID=3423409 RepID=UPI003F1A3C6F
MGELSYPVAGGGGVTDARYEQLLGDVTGSGRIAYNPNETLMNTSLVYGDSSGRQVKVRSNMAALVRGFRWETDSSGIIRSLNANTSGLTRIDLAVLRLNRSDYTVTFQIVPGVPASTPVAPAPTQTIASNGVWELPLATIRVTSSSAGDQPSIAASDVTDLTTWLAAQPQIALSTRRPSVSSWGSIFTESDTGRTYVGLGGSWHLIGDPGQGTRLTPNSGWKTPGNIFATRRNGMVSFYCLLLENGTMGNRPAGTDTTICTIPDQFRPSGDVPILAWYDGGNVARCYLDASTGRLFMSNFSVAFASTHALTIPPYAWPAKYS